MMGLLSSVLKAFTSPVASLIGTAADFGGGLLANSAAAKSADKQMDFQERLSNTSYQRAVQDMRAAGLNPALAYSQGGASTPGGASYTPQNVFKGAGNSAMQAQALEQADFNIKKTAADIANVQTNSANTAADTALKVEELAYQQAQRGKDSAFSGREGQVLNRIRAWSSAIQGGADIADTASSTARKLRPTKKGRK